MMEMNESYKENLANRMVHLFIKRRSIVLSTDPPTKEEWNAYEKEFARRRNGFKNLLSYFEEKWSLDELSDDFIHGMHKVLVPKTEWVETGQYKKVPNGFRKGGEFEYKAMPEETPLLMKEWIYRQNEFLKTNLTEAEIIRQIGKACIEFMHIHPYQDGNGRVGRSLVLYLSLKKGLYPLVIPIEQRIQYIESIRTQNFDTFAKMLEKTVTAEKELYESFHLTKQKKEKE